MVGLFSLTPVVRVCQRAARRNERTDGILLWVWIALPRVFPEKLPVGNGGGDGSFGVTWEEGRPLPVGFPLKNVGYPRVAETHALRDPATAGRVRYQEITASSYPLVPAIPVHG